MPHDPIYKPFGRIISTRRQALEFTQMELAQKSGLSRASIASIESGRQNVPLHHLYALATALQLEKVADLLPVQPKMEGGTMEISDRTVTARGKAQIESVVATALARRLPKAES